MLSCGESNNDNAKSLQVEESLLPEQVESLDSLPFMNLKDRMAYYKVPGIAWSIIEEDSIVESRFFGYRDLEGRKPIDENTLFQSASTGKSLTATLALILVNEGLLDLDGSINERLKSWKIPPSEYTRETPITLRHLLSHTAGLSTHGFDGYAKTEPLPTIHQILNGAYPANSEKVISLRQPGERFNYSGGGYQVIQLLIEEVTGRPFVNVAEDRLLKPLGLKNTFWTPQLSYPLEKRASNEFHKGNTMLPGGWYNLVSHGAGGGLWTTPEDLATFIITLDKSTEGSTPIVISTYLAKEMQTKQAPDKEFGLGLFLDQEKDYKAIYHPGGNMGFRTMLYYIPSSKQGIAIMANSDNAWYLIPEIMRAASHVYDWPSYKPEVKVEKNLSVNAIRAYERDNNIDGLENLIKQYDQTSKRGKVYDEISAYGASNYLIWRMDRAIAVFDVMNRSYPDSLDTHINLGMAHRRWEDFERALEVFRRAQALAPDDDFIRDKIVELREKVSPIDVP
ncbi:MAG: hypothetical protein Tsb004_28000 [Allomuricauda sp.]